MREGRPSGSAESVALARAHLHRDGVVDDPYASGFLGPRRRVVAAALRAPLVRAYGRSATFAFLAPRTRRFDAVVLEAIASGIDQVVVVGAGYDTRAWRLDGPGLRWFEVDHPATQAVKRQRAPAGERAPVYVGADLRHDPVAARLVDAGLDASRRAVFVVEGLTMYLTPDVCDGLLAALGAVAPAGSTLAVQFSAQAGGSTSPLSRAMATAIRTTWAWSGEPTYRWADEGLTGAMLERARWRVVESIPGDELARRFLQGTDLAVDGVNARVYCTLARRR